MSFSLSALFSFSVGIGVFIGWVRFKKADPVFIPFLLLLTIGLLNEIISLLLMYSGRSNAFNYNLYSLAEALIITWQFRKWGLFNSRPRFYNYLQILIPIGFAAEWWFFAGNRVYYSYFIIFYSLMIVLMSIYMINQLLFSIHGNLLREPVYLICMGFSIYFTYAVLVEAFWLYGLNESQPFRIGIYNILSFINLFTNLVFSFALLWTPLKPRYIMR